jgi:hypothetical protein
MRSVDPRSGWAKVSGEHTASIFRAEFKLSGNEYFILGKKKNQLRETGQTVT